jgi:hypothetical protein
LAESLRAKKTETKKYFDLPLHQQFLYAKFDDARTND